MLTRDKIRNLFINLREIAGHTRMTLEQFDTIENTDDRLRVLNHEIDNHLVDYLLATVDKLERKVAELNNEMEVLMNSKRRL